MSPLTILREIAPSAKVAPDAVIGPYCRVGPHVTLGPGTVLRRRVSLLGHTTVGAGNLFEEGCVIGEAPQDLKYKDGATLLQIGHRNRFGRNVTAHIGTEVGGYLTRIGSDNVLMEGCHVAHDCYVYDRVCLGRSVLLAGHICVETGAVMEDHSAAHHFVTIGRFARVGARTPVRRDVPPYTYYAGNPHHGTPPSVRGPHEEGIAAAKLSADEQQELRYALRELFEEETALETKLEQLEDLGVEGQAAALCEFCRRALRGVYGRHRELFRGQTPPEADIFLPANARNIRRPIS